MKTRLIIIPIDSILELFKDYAGMIAVPDDAVASRLLLNPQAKKIAIEIEAESFNGPQPTEEIRFDLQRIFSVN